MATKDLLIAELDAETNATRRTLERVPTGRDDFAPHPKSMPLGRLAPHVAQLGGFGLVILTTPSLDFATAKFTPVKLESAAQLVRVFDEGAAKVRDVLAAMEEEQWTEPWTLAAKGTSIFQGSRFLAYREMFLNHVIHHRAQLGVYLRLLGAAVPATYGPSADETLGF
jgi:uncharacterized damage-inducible protein DinB